jgi:starvation-inducible DNA-binding protein
LSRGLSLTTSPLLFYPLTGYNIPIGGIMEELINALKTLLSSTVALKYKAHGYHWNVEGDDFPQWHDKFAEIYEDLDGAIDPLAEWIRILGDYAPFRLTRFAELSTVPETSVDSEPESMAADLLADHIAASAAFGEASIKAANLGQKGLENFLADCMASHQKWVWQLRVSTKPEAPEAE